MRVNALGLQFKGTTSHHIRDYTRIASLVLAGPALLSLWVFALWSLGAEIGLAASFIWSAGPLSNYVLWLAAALALTLAKLWLDRDRNLGQAQRVAQGH